MAMPIMNGYEDATGNDCDGDFNNGDGNNCSNDDVDCS